MDLKELYGSRIRQLQNEISVLKRKKRNYGFGRLVAFASAVILFFVLLEVNGVLAASTAIVILLIFLFIVLKDMKNMRRLLFQSELLAINEEELQALDGRFDEFEDGEAFLPAEHPYARDLDILGKHSLFQFINRTTAAPSAALLAARLLSPSPAAKIRKMQQAICALAGETDWRQQLQARGRRSRITGEIYRKITDWAGAPQPAALPPAFRWASVALPCVTALAIILAATGVLSWKILWISFWLHLLLMRRISKAVTPSYQYLSGSIKAMDAFYESLSWMTTGKTFQDPYLHELQEECRREGIPAHLLLQKLKSILHAMDLRLNLLVYYPLNLAIFWDWHQYRRLQAWQHHYREDLSRWLQAYAEMEVLSSFANMAFNHPRWCFPEITDDFFTLSAVSLGHPLLEETRRVSNDMTMEGTGKVMLVTGSNMAGKSTFLRTVGVNIILAMAGSPVCAERMRISRTKIMSSMRIADNLEENISTFYAELKKLETILQQVRAHEKVFLLLDEVLRGTNSLDRHAGAGALIRQFLAEDAVAILATHDLELTGMEKQYPGNVLNYHFDVQVRDEELYFDYRLKHGICTSMNASLLMRKIGIAV